MGQPKTTRKNIGMTLVLPLLLVGLLFEYDGSGISGQASGVSKGGCGGSTSTTPSICRSDSDCENDLVCKQGDCLTPIAAYCDIPASQQSAPTTVTDAGTELSIQWEEESAALHQGRKNQLRNNLNSIYWMFRQYFSYEQISRPLRIRIFDSDDSFSNCMDALGKSGQTRPFYSTGLDRVFFNVSSSDSWSQTRKTLLHEGSHFIFNSQINGGAIIFNEGVADVMSGISKSTTPEGTIISIAPKMGREAALTMLGLDELYGLDDFFNLTNSQWQADPQVTYAQSYALIYFLMQEHWILMTMMMENLKTPLAQRTTYYDLIQDNYVAGHSDSFEVFEEDWRSWLQQTRENQIYYAE